MYGHLLLSFHRRQGSVLASDDTLQVLDRFLDYANSNIHIHNTQ